MNLVLESASGFGLFLFKIGIEYYIAPIKLDIHLPDLVGEFVFLFVL
jgi:hypothetical protein